MLNSGTPVSFRAKAQYEAATKFIDHSGKELGLKIKAISDSAKSYQFDVFVHDANEFVEDAYLSNVGEGAVQNISEFAKNAYNELRKVDNLCQKYKVKNSDNIMQGLIDFFVKSAK